MSGVAGAESGNHPRLHSELILLPGAMPGYPFTAFDAASFINATELFVDGADLTLIEQGEIAAEAAILCWTAGLQA